MGQSSKPVVSKKEKSALKHARLLESGSRSLKPLRVNLNRSPEVEASRLPYSKSHAKRLKRKAKEELAGGALSDIQSAIVAMESGEKTLGGGAFAEPPVNESSKAPANRVNPGLIGEGKATPLSQNQRKNALYAPYSEPKDCANPIRQETREGAISYDYRQLRF